MWASCQVSVGNVCFGILSLFCRLRRFVANNCCYDIMYYGRIKVPRETGATLLWLIVGDTMDKNAVKQTVIERLELENSMTELVELLPSLERSAQRYAGLLETVEENKQKLENSKIKLFALGILGKKEECLEQAEMDVHKARGEANEAQFELESVQERIRSISAKLSDTKELLEDYFDLLEKEGDTTIKERILTLNELTNLKSVIEEDIKRMKKLLSRAEEIWIYGDIQADISGKFYNKKDATLREHTYLIKSAVTDFVEHLTRYNAYAPEVIRIAFHEDWMDEKSYWDQQQLASDSHDRIKKVDNWFFNFELSWNRLKKSQKEAEGIMRSEIVKCLERRN